MKLKKNAEILDQAACKVQAIDQLSGTDNAVNLQEAYEVQKLLMQQRCARGERLIGIKMGFTSRAKMLQMGVSDLILGQLTDGMLIDNNERIKLSDYIHPRVEPELAFLLKKSLSGKINLSTAMQAVEAVAPAMEIIDSRYRNFKFSLEDVVADNASSSGFVLGNWQSASRDITHLGMVMSINGRTVALGSSAAILGNPYQSLCHAARLAENFALKLQPGWIVLAGAATAASPLQPDTYIKTEVEALGNTAFLTEEA